MKGLLALLLAGAFMLLYMQQKTISQLRLQLEAATQEVDQSVGKPQETLISPKTPNASVQGITQTQHIICPVCNGEGGIMIRRSPSALSAKDGKIRRDTLSATVEDVRETCPMCLGSGARNFVLPPRAELCPDCGGMGKRLSKIGAGAGASSLSHQGYDNQAPLTIGCSRCLGKGYIMRPGI